MSPADELRLNRFLARAGVGSRRGVEELIRAGRVAVDGETVSDLGRRVPSRGAVVTVDGRPVTLPETWRVFAFHKPAGVVSSLRGQGDAPCLAEFRERADLPASVIPVGRLDAPTTGLLIWTDDGTLAEALMLPRRKVWKRYRLTLDRPLDPALVGTLTEGRIELDGRPCRPARLEPVGAGGTVWTMWLSEGRNRQIRRMIRAVGRRVTDLHREAVGPVELDDLAAGSFRELDATEIDALREALGPPES